VATEIGGMTTGVESGFNVLLESGDCTEGPPKAYRIRGRKAEDVQK